MSIHEQSQGRKAVKDFIFKNGDTHLLTNVTQARRALI